MSQKEETEVSFSLSDISSTNNSSQRSDCISVVSGISSEVLCSTLSSETTEDSAYEYEKYLDDESLVAETNTSVPDFVAKRCKTDKDVSSIENSTQVFSGFTTCGGNKQIYVDNQRLKEVSEKQNGFYTFPDEDPFLVSNMLPIPDESGDSMINTGFSTVNQKPIFVSRSSIANNTIQMISSEDYADVPNQVNTEFKTGRNKMITVDQKSLHTAQFNNTVNNFNNTVDENNSNRLPGKKYPKSLAEVITPPSENETLDRISDIYASVQKHFKNEEDGWIFEHFKWSWMHLFLNDQIENEAAIDITSNLIEVMELKKKYERSILRRIVEFDEVPFKHMILGVIDYTSEYVELFDGFYSLKFSIDSNIYTFLKMNYCTLGSKLHVFGCELLIKQATSIFEIEGVPLKIFYNSVRCARKDAKVGRARNISFLNTISSIRPDGGVVSSLVAEISQIIDQKYLVVLDGYRNRVDDLESELENIYNLAHRAGRKIESHEISATPYYKLIIDDGTGNCVLTWWNPPEVRVGEKYMFVSLNVTEWNGKIELTTMRRTYFQLTK